jgi:DNA invertase Pin-like site-specific DNA recombinase
MDMHGQRQVDNRMFQVMCEPEPGSLAVGYICSRRDLQTSTSIDVQKRLIAAFAEKKGWKLARWYEEPEEYEGTDQRPAFAQLLSDASSQFQVVLCSASRYWSRDVGRAYKSLNHLRQLGVWWATADAQWDINTVWQEGINTVCVLQCVRAVRRDLRKSRTHREVVVR